MIAADKKSVIMSTVVTVALVFALAVIWEFGLEGRVLPDRIHESTKEHWHYVLTSTVFVIIALILPVYYSLRSASRITRAQNALQESQERFQALSDATLESVVVCEGNRALSVNLTFEKMFGYGMEEAYGISVFDLFPPEAHDTLELALNSEGVDLQSEGRALKKDGSFFDAKVHWKTIPFMGRKMRVMVVQDVSERNKVELRLKESERRFRETLENVELAAVQLDSQGRVSFANDHFLRLAGTTSGEAMGASWCDTFIPEHHREIAGKTFEEFIKSHGREHLHVELPIMASGGTERLISWNNTPMFDRDGRVIGVSSIGKDITEIRKKQEDLRILSTMDSVTGLLNRRCFDIHLDREWRRALRNSSPLAVIMLDIDHFKPYNDTYGHIKGDECLRLVAQALSCAARRAGDIVARFGGEEFAVVLPLADGQEAAGIAERMRQSVEELGIPHGSSNAGQSVTISAGVAAMVPGFEASHATLLEQADKALYSAKSMGRNRVMGNGYHPNET